MARIRIKPSRTAARILGVLAAVLILNTGCAGQEKSTQQADDAVLYLGGEAVSEEEYGMLVQEYCNEISMQYTTDEVNSEGFWETQIDGSTPYERLEEIVREKLRYNYALKKLALQMEVVEDYSYEDLVSSMKEENESREAASEQDYGLTGYDEASYYKYWYSNLETEVTGALIQKEIEIAEEDCRDYYDSNQAEYIYDIGVKILYVEISDSEENQNPALQLKAAMSQEEIDSADALFGIPEFSSEDISAEELELTSLDTQEGMSGVYTTRWELASQLEEGEVYGPYEDNGSLCIIKCLARTEGGSVDFADVKSQIERYLQTQKAQERIAQEAEGLEIKEGTASEKDLILSLVESTR